MMGPSAVCVLVLLGVLDASHAAFYLPGIAPSEFQGGDEVPVTVNKLNSVKTQLPFDYYRFNFCEPEEVKNKNENLGEVLAGEKIETSPYQFFMGKNEYCKVRDPLLCFASYVPTPCRSQRSLHARVPSSSTLDKTLLETSSCVYVFGMNADSLQNGEHCRGHAGVL